MFLVKTFARISKHIAVTSLEVTTIAFVFATLITSYFWREKPQDIYRPIYLKSHATLSEILKSVGTLQSWQGTLAKIGIGRP